MAVRVTWRVLVDDTDLACQGLSGTLGWGRQDAVGQPESAVAQLVLDDPTGSLAAQMMLQAGLQLVAVLPDGSQHVRFTGSVVDVGIDHAAGLTTVAGQGLLASLARLKVGDTPWPAELDGLRIQRIMDVAGLATGPDVPWSDAVGSWAAPGDPPAASPQQTWRQTQAPDIDRGSVTIMARDVDSQPVAQLLRDVATSARGVIFERRNGLLAYHDSLRRSHAHGQQVPACTFRADGAAFTLSLGTLVNTVTVTYGPEPEGGGGRPTVTAVNQPSVDTYGPAQVSLTTELEQATDADTLARRMVAWASQPRWQASALTVDSTVAPSTADLAAVMRLQLGDTVKVTGVAAPTPSPELRMIVEGAAEQLEGDTWAATLYLTDARQTVTPASWAQHYDLDPGRTWATVPADVAWLDATDLLY